MLNILFFIFSPRKQGVTKLNSGHGGRPRAHTELSHREIIVLHHLFHRLSVLLREHIRCVDHYYISRTRRGRAARRRDRQEPSERHIGVQFSRVKRVQQYTSCSFRVVDDNIIIMRYETQRQKRSQERF